MGRSQGIENVHKDVHYSPRWMKKSPLRHLQVKEGGRNVSQKMVENVRDSNPYEIQTVF
jgi:hypothetical protein